MTTATVQIPVMFGLRTRRLKIMLAVLVAVYAFVRLTAFGEPRSGLQWVLEAVGGVGLATALYAVSDGDEDPLPVPTTAAIAAGSLGSLAAAWWAVPDAAGVWVQPGGPLVVFAMITGLLSLRGRVRAAWVSGVIAVVLAVVWSLNAAGGTPVAGGQLTLRIAVSLIPATLMAVLIRPMLTLTGALEARRAETMHAMAVTDATVSERIRKLERFDADVRPYVRQVADGTAFDEDSAARARVLEEDLRDSVRGRGWHNDYTRDALAAARLRGVVVRVFDDTVDGGGLDAADLAVLRGGLVTILAPVDSGVVTARILPPGRGGVAMVSVVTADAVQRHACRRDSGVLVWRPA